MQDTITIEKALNLENVLFVDVRSEGEFAEDHLPNAINIPLFNNEERAAVGTLYKQRGQEQAKILGLNFVAPKLVSLYEKFSNIKEKNIILYCWRGGMRSKFVHSLISVMGIKAYRLEGGYKAYRRFVNAFFENDFSFETVVLHGLTGVGKTELISQLRSKGINTIDLESLANNRGSVYGGVALTNQPTQKYFETLLFKELWLFKNKKYVMLECESKRIGKVFLPNSLFEAMQKGKHILIYDKIANRTERIINEYQMRSGCKDIQNQLIESTYLLRQKLGKTAIEKLKQHILAGQYEDFVSYLLINYYDPLYKYPDGPSDKYDLSVDASDINSAKEKIISFIKKTYLI